MEVTYSGPQCGMTMTTSRAVPARATDVRCHLADDQPSGARPLRGDAVHGGVDGVVTEEADAHPVLVQAGRPARTLGMAARPKGTDAQFTQVADRLDDAARTGIADVIISEAHDVDPGAVEAREERGVEGEDEPTRVVGEVIGRRALVIYDREVRL